MDPTSLQKIESFFLFPVAMHRYASAGPHLLGAERKTGGANGRTDPDEDLTTVRKVSKTFTLARAWSRRTSNDA